MGFRSGLSGGGGGGGHQLMPCSSKKAFTTPEVCFVSLTYMKQRFSASR